MTNNIKLMLCSLSLLLTAPACEQDRDKPDLPSKLGAEADEAERRLETNSDPETLREQQREDRQELRQEQRDIREDQRDRQEDLRDRQEDVEDAQQDSGALDRLEDKMDRREDQRDVQDNRPN